MFVWFVPSDYILKQTYNNLSNPNHPYRHALDVDFGSKVQISEQGVSVWLAENIHTSQLKKRKPDYFGSQRTSSSLPTAKEGRKSRRENEKPGQSTNFLHIHTMIRCLQMQTKPLCYKFIAQLNPVMVIDESHNFGIIRLAYRFEEGD